ncbi:hypothetical protein BDQ17DRAFT_1237313, partial [Cyathus striatus]
ELLSKLKPLLDSTKPPNRALLDDLHRLASLAESFTEQRPRPAKTWSQCLFLKGVNLWNISGLIRQSKDHDDRLPLIAALRLAAFRLVEAGLETKPGIDSRCSCLLHILQLASKTGATLSEAGSNVVAGSVLTSAAKFEELLRNADDPDGTHRQAIACATIVYFSSRMEAAWKEGNYTVADFMSQKITGDVERLTLLPPHVRELLAFKLHQIGKSVLKGTDKQEGHGAADAVGWLQKAFSMADQLEDTAAPGVTELKVYNIFISLLRTMARAYFLSESYDRAEAVLEELVPTIDASTDHGNSEYQELRWLRLAILKRRKAGDAALLDAFKSIIDHMDLSEMSITDVLQDLRTLCHQHNLVTDVHQYCLRRTLRRNGTEPDFVDRLLLSLIFHCAKDDDHARVMQTLQSAFNAVSEAEAELPSIPTTACLTLLWQYGDRHYHAKRWAEAADWYLTGSHRLFRTSSPSTCNKCFRKAALCYIEQREYAQASAMIRRCPTTEASTHYVIFLTAIRQGLSINIRLPASIRAIHEMQKASDFDRKMLLLATQISHQAEMKAVLLPVLEALLETLKIGSNSKAIEEAMTLIRCIIKLVLKLLGEPAANKPVLVDTVVNHFRTAKVLAETAATQKATAIIFKDLSWLWRTAYNSAIQGCSEWEQCEGQISELFDISRCLLELCCQASPVDVDAEICLHLINASFAAVSGQVFASRDIMTSCGTLHVDQLRTIAADIKASKSRILDITGKEKIQDAADAARAQYFVHTLQVFEAEFHVRLKDWGQVSHIVAEIVNSGRFAVGTYEAIADILWMDKDCPTLFISIFHSLQALLRASLDHSSLSVEKFARWLRGICTIILVRNTPTDRLKAIGYVEQALSVIEENDNSEEPYPMDERQWLLATAYNTGTECLHASMLDEAKRWFEASTVICRFVPGGSERAKKVYLHSQLGYLRVF